MINLTLELIVNRYKVSLEYQGTKKAWDINSHALEASPNALLTDKLSPRRLT